MFAKALLRNQRLFGKGAVLCLATAVALPVLSYQHKVTRCEIAPKPEVNTAAVVVDHADPVSIEASKVPIQTDSLKDQEVVASEIVVDAEDEDDAAWVEEKQKCSFCKMFILSPCKKPFKNWSNCVDKAKAEDKDFAEVCSEYTKALMNCTSEHSEYFQALESAAEEDETQEEGQGESDALQSEPVAGESVEKKAYPGPSLDSVEDEK